MKLYKKIEDIDPRLRFLICFFYSVFIAIEKDFFLFFYYLILPVFLLPFINDFKKFLKGFIAVNFFIFLCWLFLPFSIPGKIILKIFKFNMTHEGIKYTLLITIKANLIFITNYVLIFSSHPVRIVHALHHLYIPEKLVNLLFFTIRYIPVIENEKNRIERAMKLRCFKPKTNIHTYKTIGNFLGQIILRSYERSKRVYKAMILRCFSGIFWVYHHFKWSKKDTFISICAIIYFSILFYLKWR
jgi:cobalt/nickel transport system permease protein